MSRQDEVLAEIARLEEIERVKKEIAKASKKTARERFQEDRQTKRDDLDSDGVNFLRTVGQGLSFGFGDELTGGARALLSGDWDS